MTEPLHIKARRLADAAKCPACDGEGQRGYGDTACGRGAGGQMVTVGACRDCRGYGITSEFVDAARSLVPALADALERAERERDEALDAIAARTLNPQQLDIDTLLAQRDAARAEVERLKAERGRARDAAQVYVERVDALGLAADDNDPKVMATAAPIGEAQADLYAALGLLHRDASGKVGVVPPAETVEQLRAERDSARMLAEVRGADRDKLQAQLAECQRERDEAHANLRDARSEIAGLQGSNAGLAVSDGFFQRRCELLEAATVRKLTPTETDAFKSCCPLCALTICDHVQEAERMAKARAERDTAEQIAKWEEATCSKTAETRHRVARIRAHAWRTK